jgi:hypothetical protein
MLLSDGRPWVVWSLDGNRPESWECRLNLVQPQQWLGIQRLQVRITILFVDIQGWSFTRNLGNACKRCPAYNRWIKSDVSYRDGMANKVQAYFQTVLAQQGYRHLQSLLIYRHDTSKPSFCCESPDVTLEVTIPHLAMPPPSQVFKFEMIKESHEKKQGRGPKVHTLPHVCPKQRASGPKSVCNCLRNP